MAGRFLRTVVVALLLLSLVPAVGGDCTPRCSGPQLRGLTRVGDVLGPADGHCALHLRNRAETLACLKRTWLLFVGGSYFQTYVLALLQLLDPQPLPFERLAWYNTTEKLSDNLGFVDVAWDAQGNLQRKLVGARGSWDNDVPPLPLMEDASWGGLRLTMVTARHWDTVQEALATALNGTNSAAWQGRRKIVFLQSGTWYLELQKGRWCKQMTSRSDLCKRDIGDVLSIYQREVEACLSSIAHHQMEVYVLSTQHESLNKRLRNAVSTRPHMRYLDTKPILDASYDDEIFDGHPTSWLSTWISQYMLALLCDGEPGTYSECDKHATFLPSCYKAHLLGGTSTKKPSWVDAMRARCSFTVVS